MKVMKHMPGVGAHIAAKVVCVWGGRTWFERPAARWRRRARHQGLGLGNERERTRALSPESKREINSNLWLILSLNNCSGLIGKSQQTANKLLKTLKWSNKPKWSNNASKSMLERWRQVPRWPRPARRGDGAQLVSARRARLLATAALLPLIGPAHHNTIARKLTFQFNHLNKCCLWHLAEYNFFYVLTKVN